MRGAKDLTQGRGIIDSTKFQRKTEVGIESTNGWKEVRYPF